MGKMKNAYNILVGKLQEKRPLAVIYLPPHMKLPL
jgi:hypothetical protein